MAPAPRPPRTRPLVVGVALLAVAVVVLGVIGVIVTRDQSGSPPGVLGPNRVLYTDDFHDPGSGWTTGSLPSGTTFGYSGQGYLVNAVGDLQHFANAPYAEPVQRLTMSVTATQVTHDQDAAGFGVGCSRNTVSAPIRYEMLVDAAHHWVIERRDGAANASSTPSVLATGTSPLAPGSSPITVSGSCLTGGDNRTTTLIVSENGEKVGQVEDTAALAGPGWRGLLEVSSRGDQPCPATVTRYVERLGPLPPR
jgi:hypothetical protein